MKRTHWLDSPSGSYWYCGETYWKLVKGKYAYWCYNAHCWVMSRLTSVQNHWSVRPNRDC